MAIRYFVYGDKASRLWKMNIDDAKKELTEAVWIPPSWKSRIGILVKVIATGEMSFKEVDEATARSLFPDAFDTSVQKDEGATPIAGSGPTSSAVHVETIMVGKKGKKKIPVVTEFDDSAG